MPDRNTDLSGLDVGDIFHAESPNGASLICLVLSVTQKTIQARRITTQESLSFDRRSGVEQSASQQAVIDSIAPLPSAVQNVFLELDRKYAALMAMDEETRFQDLERFKLTDAEKKGIDFHRFALFRKSIAAAYRMMKAPARRARGFDHVDGALGFI